MNTITNRHSSCTATFDALCTAICTFGSANGRKRVRIHTLQYFSRVSTSGSYLGAVWSATNSLKIMCTAFLRSYEYQGETSCFFFDWFVGFFARKVNLSALMDELRRFIWLHDVTCHRTLPWESCCLDSVLLSHVCNYPKYIPQSTPHNRTELSKYYPYFQQYLFHRPIPVAARSKATILRGLRVRNPP